MRREGRGSDKAHSSLLTYTHTHRRIQQRRGRQKNKLGPQAAPNRTICFDCIVCIYDILGSIFLFDICEAYLLTG